jgi:hypothetical protein
MDYRSPIQDDEHPAGVSPWGSPPATPQRNATSYNPISSSQSPTPYQYGGRESSDGFAQEDPAMDPFKRPNTASSTASTTEYSPPDQSEPSEPAAQPSASAPQQQLPPQGEPSNNGSSNAPAAQQAQQPRRPPGPKYKLQAKLTGLERTGKKDPILRFDVHVSAYPYNEHGSPEADGEQRQIYPSSGPLNSAMSAVYIPNSSSWPPI